MIVPMKKIAFLIHHKNYDAFLVDLQQLGVVDVADRGAEPDAATAEAIQKLQQIDRYIKFLTAKQKKADSTECQLNASEILTLLNKQQGEFDALRQKIALLEKLYKTLLPWGEFSKDEINRLEQNGYKIRFFEASEKKFKAEWEQQYYLEVIHRAEGTVYFIVVQPDNTLLELEADELKAPEFSASEVLREKNALVDQLKSVESFYANEAAAMIPVLTSEKIQLENKISFDRVISNTSKEASDRLMIIEGWVPEPKVSEVESFMSQQEIFFLIDEPAENEKVPVLLRNNSFSRLFEPIGKLYSLPNYKELDLTPFFAPFFMLFFGFCLGDTGYGLLFLIGASLYKPRASEVFKPFLTLIQWLGGATIIFGIVSGTFFGLNLIEMIDAGQLGWMHGMREYMLDSKKMFYFALILGAIQIVYGMVIKTMNLWKQYSFKHALSTIGWIVLIIGSLVLYALKNESNIGLITMAQYAVFAVSGVLILFMNNPGKNLLVNFGGGLWDVYSIATGVLGDLLSYIRLFALGVSSAILGYVFNDLALQMSGSTPVLSQIVFILILLIGHGLNIFMAALGAFVHPMRLTFVEFYKNAGFAGGGKAYNPFMRKSEA